MGRRLRTRGLLPLSASRPTLEAELGRLDRELARTKPGPARRVLAIERRRVLVALEAPRVRAAERERELESVRVRD